MSKDNPTGREVAISLAEWLEATAKRIREHPAITVDAVVFTIENGIEELPHTHPEVLKANTELHAHTGASAYEIRFELMDADVRDTHLRRMSEGSLSES